MTNRFPRVRCEMTCSPVVLTLPTFPPYFALDGGEIEAMLALRVQAYACIWNQNNGVELFGPDSFLQVLS